jgi:hypothetical protein
MNAGWQKDVVDRLSLKDSQGSCDAGAAYCTHLDACLGLLLVDNVPVLLLQAVSRKTRILDVVYNASNNELVSSSSSFVAAACWQRQRCSRNYIELPPGDKTNA